MIICRYNFCSTAELTACFAGIHNEQGTQSYWDKVIMANPEDEGIVKVEEKPPQPATTLVDSKETASKAPNLNAKQQSTVQVPVKDVVPELPVGVKEDSCIVLDKVATECRCGRGEFRRIVIPPGTKPGLYAVAISDGANRALYLEDASPENHSLPGRSGIESMTFVPNALDCMFKVLRHLADDSSTRILITNDSELCK